MKWFRAKIDDKGRNAFTPYIEAENIAEAKEIAERQYGKGFIKLVEEVNPEKSYSLFEEEQNV